MRTYKVTHFLDVAFNFSIEAESEEEARKFLADAMQKNEAYEKTYFKNCEILDSSFDVFADDSQANSQANCCDLKQLIANAC